MTLTAQERQNLDELKSVFQSFKDQRPNDKMSQMRAPLHLALFISPIYLLIPNQLVARPYNRNTMLCISSCLGNSKPPIIFDVEMAIWKTLFSIATENTDPIIALNKLSTDLPWERINEVSSEDSQWFDLGKFHHSKGSILLTFP